MSSSAETKPNTGAQAMKAVRNIVIAVVVLGGVFALYSGYVKNSKELTKRQKQVVELLKRDNVKDYLEASKLLDEGLKIRDTDANFMAMKGQVSAILWGEHGFAEHKDAAVSFSAKAAAAGLNTENSITGEVLAAIASGNDKIAESKIAPLIEGGRAPPPVIVLNGELHYRQGKLENAKNDFKQVETFYSRYGAFYGETLFVNGEFPAAQGAFARALEMSPNHLRSIIGKARSDVARGERIEDAAKNIEELWPSNAAEPTAALSPVLKSRVLAARSEIYYAAGNFAEAEKQATEAIKIGVDQDMLLAIAHYDLGMALAAQKNAKGAREAFDAAAGKYKQIPRLYFRGSQALAAAGDIANADALLKKYEDSGLSDKEGYLIAKGDLLVATDRPTDAIAAYQEAIDKSNQLNPDAFYKKGRVIVAQAAAVKVPAEKTKAMNSALEAFGKAIEVRERYPDAWRAQALIFIEAGEKEKALEKLNMAIKYYKEGRASKVTTDEFLAEVEAKGNKAGGPMKTLMAQWRHEAENLFK